MGIRVPLADRHRYAEELRTERLEQVERAARRLAGCDLQRCRVAVHDAQRELWEALDNYHGTKDWPATEEEGDGDGG